MDSHRPSFAVFQLGFKFASGHLRCAPVQVPSLLSFRFPGGKLVASGEVTNDDTRRCHCFWFVRPWISNCDDFLFSVSVSRGRKKTHP